MESKLPAVTCTSCERSWNSASMAEGLRLLGRCPRCNGTLNFAQDSADAPAARVIGDGRAEMAPHLVLGIPRR
jgi:hypothetical protein